MPARWHQVRVTASSSWPKSGSFGGIALQRELQVPAALIVALNGVIVVFVVSSLKLKKRLDRWVERKEGVGSG